MTVKRTLTIILALFFISILIFVYSAFNGVPFGNYIAKAKIKDYVKQVYGITEEFKMPQYDFENSSYLAIIPHEGSKIMISYNLLYNTIGDDRVCSAYNNHFQKEYEELLKSYGGNIELPVYADIYNRILANGNYSDNIYELTCFQKIYLLGIINSQKISPSDSTKMPAIVAKDVIEKLSNRFNITSLQVIYTDLNGSLELIVDGKNMLTVEKMQKHTSKVNRIDEETKKLIHELNKQI